MVAKWNIVNCVALSAFNNGFSFCLLNKPWHASVVAVLLLVSLKKDDNMATQQQEQEQWKLSKFRPQQSR